jgi:hypothetical protein
MYNSLRFLFVFDKSQMERFRLGQKDRNPAKPPLQARLAS